MIKLYTSTSCSSCRKAKAWLIEQRLPFEERDIITNPLTKEEIKNILSLTETGTDEIISIRSKVYEKLAIDFEELSLNELVVILAKYPRLLRRPLILDETRLLVGYNEEEIHQFTPREVRRVVSKQMTEKLILLEIEEQTYL
ncbi:transcriptional regulator Spx [Enterococcus hulanensis]|uniref:Transcriptional regulator Spx n=1 Tax=Enterococcus hulanensis TaxID=2559929 RepID=A0ABU3EW73_9ENTE|nr:MULTISPECIES: transcriptional regulator Spx [Enterococcus]MBX8936868.1 transcriptional regulator Spx [Enterococcus gilvus]MDT2598216.1 transcriptional regulator Spx [Enterococcus hulanensis]MDT2608279.1 transcriptional regulator Spx [Enterococcus hulanensis]MDT2615574.1 transcriptional regulator Spx [Enterococcus hulanensis]MDT2626455.1 transcriptional regulator Spx [Enterococcus hulanensis]